MLGKTLISFDYASKYLLKNKGDYDIVEGFISALLTSEWYDPVKITALLEKSNVIASAAKQSQEAMMNASQDCRACLAMTVCGDNDSYNIFPEFFLISVPLFDDVIKQEIDEWLYIMKNSEVKEGFKSPYMKKVAERLNILTMNPKEKDVYSVTVNDADNRHADTITFDLFLKTKPYQDLMDLKKREALKQEFASAAAYVNTPNAERYSRYFYINGKTDSIEIIANGALAEKSSKVDVFVQVNGRRLRLNTSLKVGGVKPVSYTHLTLPTIYSV